MDSIRWVSDSSSIWDCLPRREDEERISQRLQSSKEGGGDQTEIPARFRIVCEGKKNDRDEGTIRQRLQLDLGLSAEETGLAKIKGDSSLIWDCLRKRQDWQK